MKISYCLIAFVLSAFYLNAENIDVTQKLRITQLLPKKLTQITLGIEPAIPENFVALSECEKMDGFDLAYWGPKEVIQSYLKQPQSLKEPIFLIQISQNTKQSKFGVLDEKSIEAQLRNDKAPPSSWSFGKWGDYPYCLVSSTLSGKHMHVAYVGPNDDSGSVLVFKLIVPQTPNGLSLSMKVWDKFFTETKQLPEPLLFKALGQEMHLGYTIVDILDYKIKVIAEKRKSDSKMKFSIIPQDKTVKFHFESAFEGLMGGSWHYKEHLLKIQGSYIIDDGWMNNHMTTSVLIKEVDEFTPTPILKKNVFFKEL